MGEFLVNLFIFALEVIGSLFDFLAAPKNRDQR